jgi:hypothetical protein
MTEARQDSLIFSYKTSGNRIHEITDPFCDYEFEIKLDPRDMSTHQLFHAFSNLLSAMGFNEYSIMSGACGLAFNDMRDTEKMDKLVKEYELDGIPEEYERQKGRKELYKSVEYDSKENKYEPS